MPVIKFQPDEALDLIEGVSDSDLRHAYIDHHEVIELRIEVHHDDAWDCFNDLNVEVLPRLPHGYRWVEVENQYAVIKDETAAEHRLNLAIYGPDAKFQINYLFQVDDVTTFGFAHTRKTKNPERKHPIRKDGFRVPVFDYKQHKYGSHVQGHVIDQKDTITEVRPKDKWSAYDKKNFIPEPPDYHWGMGVRKQKVAEIRKQGAAYSQFMEYAEDCHVTIDGTPVPTAIYFSSYSCNRGIYHLKEVFNVEFEEDLSRPHKGVKYLDYAKRNFLTSPEAAPTVVPYSPNSTDRALRLLKRNSAKKAAGIADGSISSRFKDRDGLYAHTDSADIEMAGIDRRITAGKFANDAGDSRTGLDYVKRALDFGEHQIDFDEKVPLFDINAHQRGQSFFRNYRGDEDLDGLEDKLQQLWKDQAAPKLVN